jgi:hypothetical protein
VNVLFHHLGKVWEIDDEEHRGIGGEWNLASCREMVPGLSINIVALNQLLDILEDLKFCLGLETGQIVQEEKVSSLTTFS